MDKYKTIKEASKAAIALGFNSRAEYQAGFKQDPRLPAAPDRLYSDYWEDFGTWYGFLSIESKEFYLTINEASKAAIALGINSYKEYKDSYERGQLRPTKSEEIYRENWENLGTWYGFLGTTRKKY